MYCAIFLKGVTFKAPQTRAAIQIPSQLFRNEKKLNQTCIYCNSFSQHQTVMPNGLTVKCSANDCTNRFHVTCGFNYGRCSFELADWPSSLFTYCHQHFDESKSINENQVIITLLKYLFKINFNEFILSALLSIMKKKRLIMTLLYQ